MKCPGIVISALHGGAGKTILTLGIVSALKSLGKRIAPFKKGPDYIDAGWLALAAGRPCYNLDTFLLEPETVLTSFLSNTHPPEDIAVIEGNRGLYDAIDTDGSTCTAELAKFLNLPVILCVDCTKTTRTMAAVVDGICTFDPDAKICGVVLNRVAGARHENILRESISQYCHVPVLGAIPKLRKQRFPERHMGLVPTPEHGWAQDAIGAAREMAEAYLDLEAILNAALATENLVLPAGFELTPKTPSSQVVANSAAPKIGIIQDSAFQFYYPENLEALETAGAELVFTSPLKEQVPPQVDGFYIGGGFPETHAAELAGNVSYRTELKRLAEEGLPIYAECGGLMYLGETLVLKENTYPMAGILPVDFGFSKKPQGHGYTRLKIAADNPFFERGLEIKGHEFHYSKVLRWNDDTGRLVFEMLRGNGIKDGLDGASYKNVLATYTHIHALGNPEWAEAMVRNAAGFKKTSAIQ
jgi:cobyrinic acid a,c-diamide synthase